eukprot:TRINITY_DN10868_c0_g2_i12.p1 TRINITY_DN10868_c0_g2~~TRINITY_DN10868_c0_g2_i12.p1  ORF type:complete len:192 (+),score=49.87 TRINITY_DN10868_c0_g2_i12:112-687(+)
MGRQTSINEIMRAILIDWLIDVGVHFDLSQETLHYAVMYLDRALSEMVIDKSRLQLLGVTCMKIADVFNENSKEYYRQENAKEYVFITAGEYTEEELLALEKEILTLMKFQLYSPTTTHFLKLYTSLIQIDEPTKILSNVSLPHNFIVPFCLALAELRGGWIPAQRSCFGYIVCRVPHAEHHAICIVSGNG